MRRSVVSEVLLFCYWAKDMRSTRLVNEGLPLKPVKRPCLRRSSEFLCVVVVGGVSL